MGLGVDYIKLQSSQISNHCNMHLEIEKIEKEHLGHYGLQELMQVREKWVSHIRSLLIC